MAGLDIGRLCIKKAGRDAGYKAVIIGKVENGRVLIDGIDVRRKKVSIAHIEPLPQKIDITENANHETVVKALER